MFFIILCGDVMIPCSYDVIVGGEELDFVNLSFFSQFLAIKCHVSSYIWQKVVKKATSGVLKSLLALLMMITQAKYA